MTYMCVFRVSRPYLIFVATLNINFDKKERRIFFFFLTFLKYKTYIQCTISLAISYVGHLLCSSLCNIKQLQLQWREQDLRQVKPRVYRCHPLNRHLGRARIAGGVSKQTSHSLKVMLK